MGMGPQDEESKQAMGLFGGLKGQGGGASAGKPPREENYFDMWKSTFCPQFTPWSFTFLIWVANTIVYIASLCVLVGPEKIVNPLVFLGPDPRTLENWGALSAYKVQQGQVWRLFLALFMNVGFSTYMITSGALLVIGFMTENPKMSPTRMAIFYFTSGILGNLFSVCVQNELSVGNMPAVMAMVSGMLGGVVVNWKALTGAGMLRICIIFMLVFLFVILLVLSAKDDIGPSFVAISLTAEAGGFMAGLGLGMMMMPHALQRDSPYVKTIRKVGFVYTFILAAILFPVFFAAVDPVDVYPNFYN